MGNHLENCARFVFVEVSYEEEPARNSTTTLLYSQPRDGVAATLERDDGILTSSLEIGKNRHRTGNSGNNGERPLLSSGLDII